MNTREILEAIIAGADPADVIPEGADPAWWERLARNYKANKAKPKRKRPARQRTYRSRRKVDTSTVFAQQQARGRAMVEQVERVNGRLDDAPIPVYAGGVLQMTIGG